MVAPYRRQGLHVEPSVRHEEAVFDNEHNNNSDNYLKCVWGIENII
jgi:hypothetical protein